MFIYICCCNLNHNPILTHIHQQLQVCHRWWFTRFYQAGSLSGITRLLDLDPKNFVRTFSLILTNFKICLYSLEIEILLAFVTTIFKFITLPAESTSLVQDELSLQTAPGACAVVGKVLMKRKLIISSGNVKLD